MDYSLETFGGRWYVSDLGQLSYYETDLALPLIIRQNQLNTVPNVYRSWLIRAITNCHSCWLLQYVRHQKTIYETLLEAYMFPFWEALHQD